MTESDNPAGTSTVDVTIADHFIQSGLSLGPRALEGLGLMVDPRSNRLVDRGAQAGDGTVLVT